MAVLHALIIVIHYRQIKSFVNVIYNMHEDQLTLAEILY